MPTVPLPRPARALLPVLALAFLTPGLAQHPLAETRPLTGSDDLSVRMVEGIGRHLDTLALETAAARESLWRPDFSSREAHEKSIAPNRARLARIIGAVDARVPAPALETLATGSPDTRAAETALFVVHAVRWPVLPGVWGEGLLLRPKSPALARVIALPDADQIPEVIAGLAPGLPAARQHARRLAENGCEVLIPTLLDRSDTQSGNPRLKRLTNQPHREWIYRQAFALGRHPLGYEVQKVLAAVDWFTRPGNADRSPIAVVGWGEGGLIALHAAALDPRIAVTGVSGHFAPREDLAREPIYRNVFGLLREFGDAELARLIAPRRLIVEHARAPELAGPPEPRQGRAGAAPGRIATPSEAAVRAEVDRARRLAGPWASSIELIASPDGPAADAFSEPMLARLLQALGSPATSPKPPRESPVDLRPNFDPADRQRRVVAELQAFTQSLVPPSHALREEFLWKKSPTSSPEAWAQAMRLYRERFWNDILGRLPPSSTPLNPRSRQIADRPAWTAHEVVLDVRPDVFAWGYLLLPKNLQPGERRPVIVAQHGLEGLPAHLIDEDTTGRPYAAYKAFAARLAERGFIVFAPHNPYRGEFRELQRKAHPLGLTLFSFIVAQHERILDWLSSLPCVDPARIGFYGLSYGGTTALRVPAVLDRYAVTVCSGNFNEWIWKLTTTDWPGSYVFTKEYEMPEFNLGPTFGHAEMAALIAPRPFMVERGHADGVGIDEWVAFEYAKVHRLYARLKIPGRAAIEWFDGPHTIHGLGTFAFLHRHLRWPEPK